MLKVPLKTVASLLLIVLFLLSEYVYYGVIGSLSPYATYYVEIAFILLAALVTNGFEIYKQNSKSNLLISLLSLAVFGFVVRVVCIPLKLSVPFDLSSSETLIFLLLAGPIIEEAVFRGALMALLRNLKLSEKLQLLLTSIAFSCSHFLAYFDTPASFHDYIAYQAFYTLFLGLACGYIALRWGLLFAIIGHILFNSSFWAACLVLG